MNRIPSVAVLIIFFEKPEQTIESIRSFAHTPAHIYVLNNRSGKKSSVLVQSETTGIENLTFIHSKRNIGPACGRNKLIEYTSEDWLFFSDNDITVDPHKNWFTLFQQALEENPGIRIFLPRLYNVHEDSFCSHPAFKHENGTIYLIENGSDSTNYFPSGASIVNRHIFNNYGLFDNRLFAFEDYEYAIRALLSDRRPLQAIEIDNISLIHDHRPVYRSSDKKAVRLRYNENLLNRSFNRILQKHGINFDHNWQWWSKKQVCEMTQTRRGVKPGK